jgi:hypothetical protein
MVHSKAVLQVSTGQVMVMEKVKVLETNHLVLAAQL